MTIQMECYSDAKLLPVVPLNVNLESVILIDFMLPAKLIKDILNKNINPLDRQ